MLISVPPLVEANGLATYGFTLKSDPMSLQNFTFQSFQLLLYLEVVK